MVCCSKGSFGARSLVKLGKAGAGDVDFGSESRLILSVPAPMEPQGAVDASLDGENKVTAFSLHLIECVL